MQQDNPERPSTRDLAVSPNVHALAVRNEPNSNSTGRSVPLDSPEIEEVPSGFTFQHRLWVIRRSLWPITGFVLVCTIATAVISYRLTRIYEATATIDVDRRAPAGVVGQDATNSDMGDTDQFLNTQVKLIQSASVLAPVVQRFKKGGPSGTLGLPNLKVTRPVNTFLIQLTCRSADPKFAADFANSLAMSYIEQSYNIRYRATLGLATFMEKQIEELRAKMERSSEALSQFERELNMIRPEEANGIVSARLLQLNTEYTTAQAERVKKQSAYESLKNGNLAAAQVSPQGESLRHLMDRLGDAQEKFKEADRQYGQNHPEYKKALNQVKLLSEELEQAKANVMGRAQSEFEGAVNREGMLKKAVEDTKAEFDRLNARSFEYQSLKREAETDRKLYQELENRIKEAAINAGFQSSSIRLADPAQTSVNPVYPNIPKNIQFGFIVSLLLAIGVALGADAMDATLRSPEDVQRVLGIHSVGFLPLVRNWQGGMLGFAKVSSTNAASNGSLENIAPSETYEDAVRSMRNSILLGSFDHPIRTLLVTSACPAEGKTTTATHLAIAHAQQRRKTLLIDCDLRRPGVRQTLGMNNSVGLSYVLASGLNWKDQISRMAGMPDLDVLLAGAASRRYADLIGWSLPKILLEASSMYDLIVVDAPPILGFPEPLQIATSVDGVILVTLAGKTDRKAVSSAVSTLQRLRVNLIGIVLNEVTSNTTHDYYGYGYYGKYYGKHSRYYGKHANEGGA
jgi:capsular exopolysaccharide synthesis family protein